MSDIIFSNYVKAERYLLSLVNYEVLPPPMTGDAEGWHLRQFSEALGRIGNPQLSYPIIHIAGTKGKGSTARLIGNLLSALGWQRVGTFTSPHIDSFRERIAINGEPISPEDFAQALSAVKTSVGNEASEGFRTTFETLTAMALQHFKTKNCDAVVLESGMGGRLDSTNAVTSRIAVITAIGFDHQRVLGDTIQAIAGEKAGIVKPGTAMAILGPQVSSRRKRVAAVVGEHAQPASARLEIYDPKIDPVAECRIEKSTQILNLRIGQDILENVQFNVMGAHQLDNLRTALMVAKAFCDMDGREFKPDLIKQGIEAFRSPGRLELVCSWPVTIADSAHCPLSIKASLEACSLHYKGMPIILALGLMRDKKPEPILREIAKFKNIRHIITYTPASPRARSGEDLAAIARRFVNTDVRCREDILAASETAFECLRENWASVVLATGTTYSVGTFRRYIQNVYASLRE